jgi:disulfide bond formation protein DsbB
MLNFLGAFVCGALLLIAVFYFQNYLGLEPCYLCVTQRVFVALTGIIFLVAALHNPSSYGNKIYAGLGLLSSVTGAYFSAKQLWLQSLPEENIPSCGPPVEYLFDAFPMSEVVAMLLRGDGNCAKVQWEFLSISMPGWVLISFIILSLLGLYQLLRKN